MKTNKKLINVTLAFASVLIFSGLILRLLEFNFGYILGFVGLAAGLIALVFANLAKSNSPRKFKWTNLLFACSTVLVVVGFTFRLMEIGNGFPFTFLGMALGLSTFTFIIYSNKVKHQKISK